MTAADNSGQSTADSVKKVLLNSVFDLVAAHRFNEELADKAMKALYRLKRLHMGESTSDEAPLEFRCPLSRKLMLDPVVLISTQVNSGMPESRDRLSSPDEAALFGRRQTDLIGVLDDEVELHLFGSTPRRQSTASTVTRIATGFGTTRPSGVVGGTIGTTRITVGRGRGRNLRRSPALGSENSVPRTARRGRVRPSHSVLPSWYPRTPLRDITAVVRAIETRRARLGETEGQQQTGSPFPADISVSSSGAQFEHSTSVASPKSNIAVKLRRPANSKVPKIVLDIPNNSEDESLTPQKKLLNSIDAVEKDVKEKLQKLKRTPGAKKAEREKKVRTLMSMR